jgi:non-heme chloroperoxidase
MQTHFIKGGNGVRLYVEEHGPQTGPAALLLHGIFQCRLSWRKQLADPRLARYRLVLMDLRGHGLSDKPGAPENYNTGRYWADDIHAVITALQLDRPVLVGWSFAGFPICDYLREYGEDNIGGIHFIDANSKRGTDEARTMVYEDFSALIAGLFSNDVTENIAGLEAFLKRTSHTAIPLEDYYMALGYNVIVPTEIRSSFFDRVIDNDDVLSQVTVPVLITHGREDAIVRVNAAEHHARVMPHAELSIYDGVGHSPLVEDTERFNTDLARFIDKCHPPT